MEVRALLRGQWPVPAQRVPYGVLDPEPVDEILERRRTDPGLLQADNILKGFCVDSRLIPCRRHHDDGWLTLRPQVEIPEQAALLIVHESHQAASRVAGHGDEPVRQLEVAAGAGRGCVVLGIAE